MPSPYELFKLTFEPGCILHNFSELKNGFNVFGANVASRFLGIQFLKYQVLNSQFRKCCTYLLWAEGVSRSPYDQRREVFDAR